MKTAHVLWRESCLYSQGGSSRAKKEKKKNNRRQIEKSYKWKNVCVIYNKPQNTYHLHISQWLLYYRQGSRSRANNKKKPKDIIQVEERQCLSFTTAFKCHTIFINNKPQKPCHFLFSFFLFFFFITFLLQVFRGLHNPLRDKALLPPLYGSRNHMISVPRTMTCHLSSPLWWWIILFLPAPPPTPCTTLGYIFPFTCIGPQASRGPLMGS